MKDKTATSVTVKRDALKASRTAKGTKSLNNGDAIAKATEGLTVDQVFTAVKKFTKVDCRADYEHLNPGMQRMCLGNRLRGFITKGGKVADLKAITGPMQEKAKAKASKPARAKKAKAA